MWKPSGPSLRRFIDLTGKRFGRLAVIRVIPRPPKIKSWTPFWRCKCDCGRRVTVGGAGLRCGEVKSCGCLRKEILEKQQFSITHGASIDQRKGRPVDAEYLVLQQMKQRCFNPKHAAYPGYGGRGITICKRWMKYENFLEDMGRRPSGLSIERINNDRGYSPGNCKWGTKSEQSRNQRKRNLGK
jgi:hypothetical protein